MKSAQEIIDSVIVRLEDPEYKFFSTSDLVLAFNNAMDEIADATEIHELTAMVKRKKGAPYADLRGVLGTNVLRVTAIWNPSTSRWLEPTTVDELDSLHGRRWERRTDESRWWFMRGLFFLGTYPTCGDDISPLRIHYSATFPHVKESGGLVTGLTTKPELPTDFTEAIENHMLYELFAQRKETEKSLAHYQNYAKAEKVLRDLGHNRMRRDKIPMRGAKRSVGGLGARR
jgi:hypothetical protein